MFENTVVLRHPLAGSGSSGAPGTRFQREVVACQLAELEPGMLKVTENMVNQKLSVCYGIFTF